MFEGLLDYPLCNVTYILDKGEKLLFESEYEVMDLTTQIYVNSF